jgi:hypothetical protein
MVLSLAMVYMLLVFNSLMAPPIVSFDSKSLATQAYFRGPLIGISTLCIAMWVLCFRWMRGHIAKPVIGSSLVSLVFLMLPLALLFYYWEHYLRLNAAP